MAKKRKKISLRLKICNYWWASCGLANDILYRIGWECIALKT